jgi:hypothetical protein
MHRPPVLLLALKVVDVHGHVAGVVAVPPAKPGRPAPRHDSRDLGRVICCQPCWECKGVVTAGVSAVHTGQVLGQLLNPGTGERER